MKKHKVFKIAIFLFAVATITVASAAFGQVQGQSDYLKNFDIRTAEDLPDFVKLLKTIRLLEDQEDDIINKLGKPSSQNVLFGKKVWRYEFLGDGQNSVVCVIEYDLNDKAAHVYVTKAGPGGVEQIYSQGNSQLNSNVETSTATENNSSLLRVPVSAAVLDSPEEGQIYFNTTDKCFYGWNGSAWIKLGGG
jgi:hypothetical protein